MHGCLDALLYLYIYMYHVLWYIRLYDHIYIYIVIYEFDTKERTRLQEVKGSILMSAPAVAQTIVSIVWRTWLSSPNRSRTELTPKFLDRSSPSSVPRLFHTLVTIEIHWKLCKIKQKYTLTLTNVSEIDGNGPRVMFLRSEMCFVNARRSI